VQQTPTFADYAIFSLKSRVLRHRRILQNWCAPVPKWPLSPDLPTQQLRAESISALWDLDAPFAEKILQAGKIQNLRMACLQLDGCHVPANQIFSFWRQLGQPSRRKGYVEGRELRQGCIIPSIGGGLCQLSNALYDAALKADCTICERHAHTQIIPGSLAEIGRDATVFWNYVDLRFKWHKNFVIRASMTSDNLIVQLWEAHA